MFDGPFWVAVTTAALVCCLIAFGMRHTVEDCIDNAEVVSSVEACGDHIGCLMTPKHLVEYQVAKRYLKNHCGE